LNDEVFALKEQGYNPLDYYQGNAELKGVLDSIAAGDFSDGDTQPFQPIIDSLLQQVQYLLLVDYASLLATQEQAATAYLDREAWTRTSIFNTAHCGFYSSDRTMRQYIQDI
jgi:starch phosphorylase